MKTKYICKQCKKVFERINCGHKYIFCSHKCHSNSQIGKPTRRFNKIKRKGYWFIYLPEHINSNKQGYIAEHKIIVEKNIGRILKKEERVHHINHIITDNRIENLMLFKNNGEHLRDGHPELAERYKKEFKGKHFSKETEFKKKTL